MKREELADLAYHYEGNWHKISLAIIKKRKAPHYDIQEKYVTLLDEEYPSGFRDLKYPPWVIFYEGNLNLWHKPCLTIVGSRKASPYGQKATR